MTNGLKGKYHWHLFNESANLIITTEKMPGFKELEEKRDANDPVSVTVYGEFAKQSVFGQRPVLDGSIISDP